MRLVVQVQAVADQLLQLDFRRAFLPGAIESATVASVSTTAAITARTVATITARTIATRSIATGSIAPRTVTARSGPTGRAPLRAATFPRRTAFLFLLLLLFCHVLNLCPQSGPFQGHQARGPQLHFRRFPAHHLADQMAAQLLELTVAGAAQNPVEAPLETPRVLDVRAAAVS